MSHHFQSLPDEDPLHSNGTSIFEQPVTDLLIHAEVMLPQGEELKLAKVKSRTRSSDSDVIGTYGSNPLLNSILYDVEFPNGQIKHYSANIIAENMYSQVDADGYSTTILESIVDYKKDSKAVDKAGKYVITKSGQKRLRKTTVGW